MSPNSDEMPAWIKGDLPAEAAGAVADADGSSAVPQPDEVQDDRPAAEAPTEPDDNILAVEPPETEPSDNVEPVELLLEALPNAQAEPAPILAETLSPSAEETTQPPPVPADVALDASHHGTGSIDGVLSPEPTPIPAPPVAEPLSLEAEIESLLFVADGAVTLTQLAEALEVSNRDIEAALATLGQSYSQRGLSLQRFREKVQLTTSPSAAARVERFLGLAAASPLSRAALETLAIVAYQQPVTRPQIEAVRGVNSDSVIKNLLSKGLIEESGRAEGPGRPVLYVTTPEFMQHFGLASLTDLPPLSLPGLDTAASHERILKG